jgi:hypothetical protein
MGHCSIPRFLGFQEWFESRFGAVCQSHDLFYRDGQVSRFQADCQLMAGMASLGYPFVAVCAFLFVRMFGWAFYKGAK